jgi:hypothetical protein
MPIPVTFPKIWRRGVSFESAPNIGRVLMVGNGGLSEDVSIQPAERISRMITIEKINERLRAIEKLLFQLAVESLSMVTRKSFGHSVYPLILGPKIILDPTLEQKFIDFPKKYTHSVAIFIIKGTFLCPLWGHLGCQ